MLKNIYCAPRITIIGTVIGSLLSITCLNASENPLPKNMKATAAAELVKTTLQLQVRFPLDYLHHSSIRITNDSTLQIDRAGIIHPVSGDIDKSFDPVNGPVDFQQGEETYAFSLAHRSITQTFKKESVIHWSVYHKAVHTIAANNSGESNHLENLKKRFGSIIPTNYMSGCATSSQNLLATANRDGTVKIYSIDE